VQVLDGFTLDDSLVIKAQVQVIRDRPQRPFRCLDGQYRRELARVYLANVEGLARRFVDEKREQLQVGGAQRNNGGKLGGRSQETAGASLLF
jgi:hypothetical protein